MIDIRVAQPEDLDHLPQIEAAADQLFEPLMDISGWQAPASGHERSRTSGFILVAGTPAVGFAHVIEVGGYHHLEQLAVQPEHGREGIGTALVYAAADKIAAAGGTSLSLLTFEKVPWNKPFYSRLGFDVADPAPAYLAGLIERESSLGLERGGPRVAMIRQIAPGVEPIPAVSVIPVRDGDRGLEVFVQHRVHTMDFAPGVVVFPGGRVDPVDGLNASEIPEEVLHDLIDAWQHSSYVGDIADAERAVRTIVATALREMHEETSVGLTPSELIAWDDWTTPPGFPKRFQVHFFVVHLPHSDPRSPHNTTTEALASEWLPVTEVLDRANGGDLQLMTPTRVILLELAALRTAQAVTQLRPQVLPVRNDHSEVRPRQSRPSAS